MCKLRYLIVPLFVILLLVPVNSFAQERAFEDKDWNVNVGLGVGMYDLIPMPDLELSTSYRMYDFYRLGLQINCFCLILRASPKTSQKFQYHVLVTNFFDFIRQEKATLSAKVGLGYSYLFYRDSGFLGEYSPMDCHKFNKYCDGIDVHSFSMLVSLVFDYRLTDLFSLGFSMPLIINFNKYRKYWGGFNLLFNMGFHIS